MPPPPASQGWIRRLSIQQSASDNQREAEAAVAAAPQDTRRISVTLSASESIAALQAPSLRNNLTGWYLSPTIESEFVVYLCPRNKWSRSAILTAISSLILLFISYFNLSTFEFTPGYPATFRMWMFVVVGWVQLFVTAFILLLPRVTSYTPTSADVERLRVFIGFSVFAFNIPADWEYLGGDNIGTKCSDGKYESGNTFKMRNGVCSDDGMGIGESLFMFGFIVLPCRWVFQVAGVVIALILKQVVRVAYDIGVFKRSADAFTFIFIGILLAATRGVEETARKNFWHHLRLTTELNAATNARAKVVSMLAALAPISAIRRMIAQSNEVDYRFAGIVYSDIVGFTAWCRPRQPTEVVVMLNEMYSRFDALLVKHRMLKVKTIGDAYWAVCGLVDDTEEPVVHAVLFADGMTEIVHQDVVQKHSGVDIRVGLHAGPVFGGLIRNAYEVFGQANEVAEAAEAAAPAGCIALTKSAFECVDSFDIKANAVVEPSERFVAVAPGEKLYVLESIGADVREKFTSNEDETGNGSAFSIQAALKALAQNTVSSNKELPDKGDMLERLSASHGVLGLSSPGRIDPLQSLSRSQGSPGSGSPKIRRQTSPRERQSAMNSSTSPGTVDSSNTTSTLSGTGRGRMIPVFELPAGATVTSPAIPAALRMEITGRTGSFSPQTSAKTSPVLQFGTLNISGDSHSERRRPGPIAGASLASPDAQSLTGETIEPSSPLRQDDSDLQSIISTESFYNNSPSTEDRGINIARRGTQYIASRREAVGAVVNGCCDMQFESEDIEEKFQDDQIRMYQYTSKTAFFVMCSINGVVLVATCADEVPQHPLVYVVFVFLMLSHWALGTYSSKVSPQVGRLAFYALYIVEIATVASMEANIVSITPQALMYMAFMVAPQLGLHGIDNVAFAVALDCVFIIVPFICAQILLSTRDAANVIGNDFVVYVLAVTVMYSGYSSGETALRDRFVDDLLVTGATEDAETENKHLMSVMKTMVPPYVVRRLLDWVAIPNAVLLPTPVPNAGVMFLRVTDMFATFHNSTELVSRPELNFSIDAETSLQNLDNLAQLVEEVDAAIDDMAGDITRLKLIGDTVMIVSGLEAAEVAAHGSAALPGDDDVVQRNVRSSFDETYTPAGFTFGTARPDTVRSHVEDLLLMAVKLQNSFDSRGYTTEIGLECGPLTAGVIGTDRLFYDTFGGTVNAAHRVMALTGSCVSCTQNLWEQCSTACSDRLAIRNMRNVTAKGIGQLPVVDVYFQGSQQLRDFDNHDDVIDEHQPRSPDLSPLVQPLGRTMLQPPGSAALDAPPLEVEDFSQADVIVVD